MNDLKEAYLNYLNSDKEKAVNIIAYFNKGEVFEKNLVKDLSEWNAEEIINFYKSICTPSIDFLYNIHTAYKKYATWCLNKNLLKDNINHYDEITMDTLMQCINKGIADQKIISREDLLAELNKLDNPRDQFICLACFDGIGGVQFKDMINLKMDDFDLISNGIIIERKEPKKIPYDEQLYLYAKMAAETDTYQKSESQNPNRIYKMAGEPGQIIKKILSNEKADTYSIEVKPQIIYDAIKSVKDKTNNPAFTSKALKESGRIYMIKQEMAKDKQLSLPEAIKKTISRYGNLVSISSYINKYCDFLK